MYYISFPSLFFPLSNWKGKKWRKMVGSSPLNDLCGRWGAIKIFFSSSSVLYCSILLKLETPVQGRLPLRMIGKGDDPGELPEEMLSVVVDAIKSAK